MKVLVAVKRVVDYNVRIRVRANGTGVDTDGVKMSMNPFDEIAIEQAVRLKEAGQATEVVVVTIGGTGSPDTLRTALAMGADRGVHIDTDADVEPLAVAKVLAQVVDREAPQLVLLGKQAIDGDDNQVAQMLASLLGWGQGTFASTLDINDDQAQVTREVDGGLQSLSLKLPCVVSTDLRLNEPRYASLPNIMKAKKKPIDTIAAAELGIELTPRLETLSVEEPPARQAGRLVASVDELVDALKTEAGVI